MSVLYFLVPLALLLAGSAVLAFMWAVRHGQFDDVHTPAVRMLLEDDVHEGKNTKDSNVADHGTIHKGSTRPNRPSS